MFTLTKCFGTTLNFWQRKGLSSGPSLGHPIYVEHLTLEIGCLLGKQEYIAELMMTMMGLCDHHHQTR